MVDFPEIRNGRDAERSWRGEPDAGVDLTTARHSEEPEVDNRDTVRYAALMNAGLRSIPATVFPDGTVTLAEPVELPGTATAMVTILVEDADRGRIEPALLSQAPLEDWNLAEEDEAWNYLREVI